MIFKLLLLFPTDMEQLRVPVAADLLTRERGKKNQRGDE